MDRVDAAADAKKSSGPYMAKGGFKHLRNIQASHYEGRKPLMGHGPNRYCYQLVALKERVNTDKMGKGAKDGKGAAIGENVFGWGQSIDVHERKWEGLEDEVLAQRRQDLDGCDIFVSSRDQG